MNKTTSEALYNLSGRTYGNYVVAAIERYPKLYKENKKRADGPGEHSDPLPMVKYLIRRARLFGDRRITLPSLAEGTDKYKIVKHTKFCGQFCYDKKQGGFVPMYIETRVTEWLKSVLEKYEKRFVHNAWNKAKTYLTLHDGSDPILIYNIDQTVSQSG